MESSLFTTQMINSVGRRIKSGVRRIAVVAWISIWVAQRIVSITKWIILVTGNSIRSARRIVRVARRFELTKRWIAMWKEKISFECEKDSINIDKDFLELEKFHSTVRRILTKARWTSMGMKYSPLSGPKVWSYIPGSYSHDRKFNFGNAKNPVRIAKNCRVTKNSI